MKGLEKFFLKAGFRFSVSHREGVGWTPSEGLKMTDFHKNEILRLFEGALPDG